METVDFVKKATGAIVAYHNKNNPIEDHISSEDVYVVWYAKALQNSKGLLSTNKPDGMYYEVTYNGNKDEFYLDAYSKKDNVVVANTEGY